MVLFDFCMVLRLQAIEPFLVCWGLVTILYVRFVLSTIVSNTRGRWSLCWPSACMSIVVDSRFWSQKRAVVLLGDCFIIFFIIWRRCYSVDNVMSYNRMTTRYITLVYWQVTSWCRDNVMFSFEINSTFKAIKSH